MMFSFAAFALVSALTASAADINVRVGDGGVSASFLILKRTNFDSLALAGLQPLFSDGPAW